MFFLSQPCLSPLVHMGMTPVPPFEAPGPLQLKISSQRTACTVCDTAGPTGSHLWKKTVSEVINRSPCSNSNVVAISEPAVVVVKCYARFPSVGQLLQVSASKYGWPSFSLAQMFGTVCTHRKVTIVAQALFRRTGHRRYTLQRRGLATPVGQRV